MATRTISDSGGTRLWSDTASWVEGAVPTAADDVVSTTTAGALRVSATANCRSLDFDPAGGRYANTFTHDAGITINVGTSSGPASGVAVRFSPSMTYTKGVGSTFTMKHTVTNGGAGWTLTSAGKTMCDTWIVGGAAGGSWVLTDTWNMDPGNVFYNQFGTFDTAGFAMNIGAFNTNWSNVRALLLRSSVITMTNGGTPWNATTITNLTFTPGTSTLVFAGSGGTMQMGGLTYASVQVALTAGNFAFAGGGSMALTVAFGGTAVHNLTLPASTTTTLTALAVTSNATSRVQLQSSSSGTPATVSVAAGTIEVEDMKVKDITAGGGATFNAINSVDVSGNTGWNFVTRQRSWGVCV